MTLTELRSRAGEITLRQTAITAAAEARFADPEDTTEVRGSHLLDENGNPTELDLRFGGLTEDEATELRGLDGEAATLQIRMARLAGAERSGGTPAIADFNVGTTRTDNPHDFEQTRGASLDEVRGQAFTAVERTAGVSDSVRSALTDRLQELDNPVAYRHAIATSSEEFRRDFHGAMFGRPSTDAGTRARLAADEQRAALGLGSGQITPVTLDPTLILTGDIEINPFRSLADVETITTPLAQYNSMGEMIGSMDLEHEEVSDDTPSVAPGTIDVRKGQLYGEFSIELEMDMPAFERAMRRNLGRGKDKLEAAQMAVGTGTGKEVQGVLTGMTASAIANVVSTTIGALHEDDFTDLVESLQVFHRGSAVFVAALETQHLMRKLETTSGDRIWANSLQASEPGQVLGRPVREASLLPSVATGATPVIFGNFAEGYRIVDRIGMTVVPVGMVNGTNGRPNGNRGVYAYWRFGAGVVNPNAIRVLEIA